LTPADVFCPNLDCPARGQTNQGNIRVHPQPERGFSCGEGGRTCSATKGTRFYRLKKSVEVIRLVVTFMAHGCPLPAMVVAFGFDERRVKRWLEHSRTHCPPVQEHRVEQPPEVGQVQGDEICVKAQAAVLWMAMAMRGSTSWWLGGEISRPPDAALIERLIKQVQPGASAWGGAIRLRH